MKDLEYFSLNNLLWQASRSQSELQCEGADPGSYPELRCRHQTPRAALWFFRDIQGWHCEVQFFLIGPRHSHQLKKEDTSSPVCALILWNKLDLYHHQSGLLLLLSLLLLWLSMLSSCYSSPKIVMILDVQKRIPFWTVPLGILCQFPFFTIQICYCPH